MGEGGVALNETPEPDPLKALGRRITSRGSGRGEGIVGLGAQHGD